MEQAIIISTDSTVTTAPFDASASYEFIKTSVGGWIEHLPTPIPGVDAYINEEGKIHGLPHNPLASKFFEGIIFDWDHIVGPVVFVATDEEGDTKGLSQEQFSALTQRLGIA